MDLKRFDTDNELISRLYIPRQLGTVVMYQYHVIVGYVDTLNINIIKQNYYLEIIQRP